MKKIYALIALAAFVQVSFAQHNVTFSVDMNQYTGTFTEPNVNGTYNAWCGSCNPLTDANNDGIWEGTFQVPAGLQEFKFTVDGWTDQENFVGGESCTMTTGGFTNRVITVNGDTTLGTVCFNSCDPCMAPPPDYNVTFQVDMNGYAGTFTEANLNGTFNGWCGPCDVMTDGDGDGIYDITMTLPAGMHEFKYTVDGWTDQENFVGGETCTMTTGGFTNRVFDLQGDTTIPVVCWGQCDPCAGFPQPVMVTMTVDMGNEFVCSPGDSVDVAGSFTNWGDSALTMTNVSGDIYEITVPLFTNTQYSYKFRNRVGGTEKWESGNNRDFMVHNPMDTSMAMVCFEQTGPCGPAPIGPIDVTFRVDMNNEIPADSLWVIGSFTTPQWQDGRIPLTFVGDGVFEATEEVCPDNWEYKFVNGDVTVPANEEFDGDTAALPCNVDNNNGGYNRTFAKASANDTILPVYVFGSCEINTTGISEAEATVDFQVFPNPLSGTTNIQFADPTAMHTITVVSITGQNVINTQFRGTQMELDASGLAGGIYILQVSDQTGAKSFERLIVE